MKQLFDWWLRRAWRPPASLPAPESASLARPITLITGASEGIGLALAIQCAGRGDALLLIGRNPAALQAAERQIRDAIPQAWVSTLILDITADDAIARIEAWLETHQARIEVLINNAGSGLSDSFESHTGGEISDLLDLNVVAATRLMRHVLPGTKARGSGGIINIASLGGLIPGPYQAAYYASKAYLISLTRAVAWESRGQGVRIIAVAPGPVETGFHAKMNAENALYRLLLPSLSAHRVAKSALFGYDMGRTLVVPGLMNKAAALCLHVLPASLIIPLIAILLKPRGEERHVRGED